MCKTFFEKSKKKSIFSIEIGNYYYVNIKFPPEAQEVPLIVASLAWPRFF